MALRFRRQFEIPEPVLHRHRLDDTHRSLRPARSDVVLDVRLVRSLCRIPFRHFFLFVSRDHGSELCGSRYGRRLFCIKPQEDCLHCRTFPRGRFGRILLPRTDDGSSALTLAPTIGFVIAKFPNLPSFLTFFDLKTSILKSRAREHRKPSFRVNGTSGDLRIRQYGATRPAPRPETSKGRRCGMPARSPLVPSSEVSWGEFEAEPLPLRCSTLARTRWPACVVPTFPMLAAEQLDLPFTCSLVATGEVTPAQPERSHFGPLEVETESGIVDRGIPAAPG